MALYIARCTDQQNPKIHFCIAPNKTTMRAKGINIGLPWEKQESESTYQAQKAEALIEMGYIYQRPEDGITENTVR